MTLRDSLDLMKMVNPEGGLAVLEHEMMAERASSLNAAEAKVVWTMDALLKADPALAACTAAPLIRAFACAKAHLLPQGEKGNLRMYRLSSPPLPLRERGRG